MTCMNERQNKYFYAKTTMFCDSTEDVKVWLSNVGRPYVQSNGNNIEPPDNQSVFSDQTNLEDSASSTSSARIKAEADNAALMERMDALKRSRVLEVKEEELRREKEPLAQENGTGCSQCKTLCLGDQFKVWF